MGASRGKSWGRALALVLVSGVLVGVGCRLFSSTAHERMVHVDVTLEVAGDVENACLARVFAKVSDEDDALSRYGSYVMPVGEWSGPDRSGGGTVAIHVVYVDHVATTLRVVSELREARPEAPSVSAEEWRTAEKNAEAAVEKILSHCVAPENLLGRSCSRWGGSPSPADCAKRE